MSVNEPVFFVGGTGRSGTTAVSRLLGRHPCLLRVAQEMRFHSVKQGFPSLLRGDRSVADFRRWMDRRVYQRGDKGLRRRVSWDTYNQLMDDFESVYERDPYRALRRLVCGFVGQDALWVESTPSNVESAHILLSAFHSAKLIVCMRDGRDVIASAVSQTWGPRDWGEGLEWWTGRVCRASEALATLNAPERVIVVQMEDFVGSLSAFDSFLAQVGLDDHSKIRNYYIDKFSGDRLRIGRWQELPDAEMFATAYERAYSALLADGVWPLPAAPL